MRFYKLYAILISSFLIISLYGCSTTVENYSDELVSSKWQASLDNGYIVNFEVNDNIGKLSINSATEKNVIKGVTLLSEDSVVITDDVTGETYAFTYSITGCRLTLVYDGYSLEFSKV